mmetsp:Transcript_17431/g.48598  ORF Transcript_17431/g.48598 Transcript_17431/m.48598 type:complete len:217 (+) Transcript_17431:402-1052(+)
MRSKPSSMQLFQRKTKLDITGDSRAMQRLRRACENAKRTLSTSTSATVELEALKDGVDLRETISRARFEELCLDLFKKTMEPVTQVLKDAKKAKADIQEVVLVGGSTRIPRASCQLPCPTAYLRREWGIACRPRMSNQFSAIWAFSFAVSCRFNKCSRNTSMARSPTRALTLTSRSPMAPPCREACYRARPRRTPRTYSSSTWPRCRSALRQRGGS